MNFSILIVEDDTALAESLCEILEEEGYSHRHASTGTEGLKYFEEGEFEVVLTDFRLPEIGGLQLLQTIREINSRVPVVVMTAHGTTDLAIEATQKGAFDYLLKPFKTEELLEVLKRAKQTARMATRKVRYGEGSNIGRRNIIVGNSRKMQTVYREIGKIANKNVTVLIRGETGTGKEVVAQAIYQHSDRSEKPFIAVNCTAIPDNLLESELFGHEKGSFTGAVSKRIGRFEQASGGTLFLDEIGDMTPETQVKMLRVLQERKIRRVGGDEEIDVDVRVIAATHQDIDALVAEGKFREDLYYRINTAIINLPPLRERDEDTELLLRHFLELYCGEFGAEPPKFGKGAIDLLHQHSWPGNVRELENMTRKIIIQANGFPISKKEVDQLLTQHSATSSTSSDIHLIGQQQRVRNILQQADDGEIKNAYHRLIEDLEREMVAQALEMKKGNQSAASTLLGVSRVTFREKMEKYGFLNKKK